MAFQDLLLLDHFLYSFKTSDFNRLKMLCEVLKHCEHTKVVRPDASYEGVYLLARDGSYLELLLNPEKTPNKFALAVSTLSPNQTQLNELPKRYPHLSWSTQQIFDADNKPWHTYFGQHPLDEVVKQGIILWAMQYQNLRRHRPYQYQKKPRPQEDYTIQEFTATRFKIPPRYLDIVRVQSQWVPGNHTIGDKKAILRILNPSLNEFEIIMEVDEAKSESKPVSVTMQLVEDAELKSQEVKGLRLTRQQNSIIINF